MWGLLKTELQEWARFVNWRRDLPSLGGLLVLTLLLQLLGGAFTSEFGGQPDEPAHYVTGLMIRDYVATSLGKHPLTFAEEYYDHYPKVALGNWPPVFYVMQTAWTLPFGPSRVSLMLFMAVVTTLVAWMICRVLGTEFGRRAGFAGGALFIALPLVQEQTACLMTELPITLFAFSAALFFGRFLDQGKTRDAVWFGVLASLGILTKGSALALALAVPLVVIFTRRFDLLRRPVFWLPVPIVLILAGPWTLKFREQAKAGWEEPGPTLAFTQKALAYYPAKLVLAAGATLFILAMIGLVIRSKQWRTQAPGQGKWAMASALFISVVLVHFVIPCGTEPRHLIPALPSLVLFIIAGGLYLGREFPQWKRWIGAIAAVTFFGGAFQVYEKGMRGLGPVAQQAIDQLPDRSARVLISSDATGEGVFIAEVAMREQRPGHTIRRASKLLASSSWSGAGYQPKFATDTELLSALDQDGIRFIVTDDSIPANRRVRHHDQLLTALNSEDSPFRLAGKHTMIRAGERHESALSVFVRKP